MDNFSGEPREMPHFKNGNEYVLDKDSPDASVVRLVAFGNHFATVEAGGVQWRTMLSRLSDVPYAAPETKTWWLLDEIRERNPEVPVVVLEGAEKIIVIGGTGSEAAEIGKRIGIIGHAHAMPLHFPTVSDTKAYAEKNPGALDMAALVQREIERDELKAKRMAFDDLAQLACAPIKDWEPKQRWGNNRSQGLAPAKRKAKRKAQRAARRRNRQRHR